MAHSKKFLAVNALVDPVKVYTVDQAFDLLAKTSTTKFDSTVDVAIRLNVDPRHAEQMLRGSLVLPKGTGKTRKVLVITNNKQKEATDAQADYVGGKEIIEKIQKDSWFDYDVIIATPEMMGDLGKIGKILGPKGLMPTAKLGTVTTDVAKAIEDIKKGKIEYRVDKNGNVHAILGKISFAVDDLKTNYAAFVAMIKKVKPHTVKGIYIKNISISTTMGPGIKVQIEH